MLYPSFSSSPETAILIEYRLNWAGRKPRWPQLSWTIIVFGTTVLLADLMIRWPPRQEGYAEDIHRSFTPTLPGRSFSLGGVMKRCRVTVEQTKRTTVQFLAEDEADQEEIREIALGEAKLAEWDDDPPEVVSIEIIDPPWVKGYFQEGMPLPPLDKHARRQRIEKLPTMVEDLNTLDALPLPEQFHKLVAWAEKHLSPAEQEWLYQQWQRALERCVEESSGEPAP
jgi:hypothetical protein